MPVTIEDELRGMFEERSALMDRPVRADDIHVRVRRVRRRRAGVAASGVALAVVATAMGVFAEREDAPVASGGPKSTAVGTATAPGEDLETVGYSVTLASDGAIKITLREVFDAPKLIARLNGLGVKAVPLKRGCPAPDGELDHDAAKRAVKHVHERPAVGGESQQLVELRPERMESGYTLIFGAWSRTSKDGGEGAYTFAGLRLNPGAKAPTCLPE